MLTRSRPRLLKTSIGHLPLELFEAVLEGLSADRNDFLRGEEHVEGATLARCARVAKSWTQPSLARLYLRVYVKGERMAEALLESAAFGQYPTTALLFNRVKDKMSLIERLLDKTSSLSDLSLVNTNVQAALFAHPRLDDLKRLTLYCQIGDNLAWLSRSSEPLPPIKFRLCKLNVDLSEDQIPLLNAIIERSLPGGIPSLEIPRIMYRDCESNLLPLLPTLTTLTLSEIYIDRVPNFANLLPLATSLSRLNVSIATGDNSRSVHRHRELAKLFNAITSPLKVLELSVQEANDISSELLGTLEKGFGTWSWVEGLSRFILAGVISTDVVQMHGYETFQTAVKDQGFEFEMRSWKR